MVGVEWCCTKKDGKLRTSAFKSGMPQLSQPTGEGIVFIVPLTTPHVTSHCPVNYERDREKIVRVAGCGTKGEGPGGVSSA